MGESRPRYSKPWGPLVLLAVALLSLQAVHAQNSWEAGVATTSEELWGVCHGGGQFVAVGKGGTILTSPDGRQWTPRASGTRQWLTSVTYGGSRYIAVGDGGLVLVSPDAVSWSPRPSGVAARLNAVHHAWGRFVAVGERGAILRSDTGDVWHEVAAGRREALPWLRGLTLTSAGFFTTGQDGYTLRWVGNMWSSTQAEVKYGVEGLEGVAGGHDMVVAVGARGAIWRWAEPDGSAAAINSPVTTELAAVIFANNRFVAVGGGGMVLLSEQGAAWTPRPTPTTQSLRAIAASPTAFVAVGLGGAIVRSDFAQHAPQIAKAPTGLTDQMGSRVGFSVKASGSEPLSYQWFRDDLPVAGATSPHLVLPGVAAADAGGYRVEVRNAAGSISSPPARLAVTADSLPSGLVDPGFAAAPSGPVRAIQPLADGRVVIAGDFSYERADTTTQQGIARLTPAGQFDPGFDVGAGVAGGTATTLALQADGKILVGGNFTSVRGRAQPFLARLNADGTVDGSFVPPAEITRAPSQIGVLSDGRILIADGGAVLRWLRADGSLAQTSQAVPWSGAAGINANFRRFDVRPDGSVVAAGSIDYVESWGATARFRADGSLDPGGPVEPDLISPNAIAVRAMDAGRILVVRQGTGGSRISSQGPTYFGQAGSPTRIGPAMSNAGFISGAAFIYPDGRAVLSAGVSATDQPLATGSAVNSLLRINPDGSIDDTFLVGPGIDGNVYAIAPSPDGGLYVGGAFTSVAGVARTRLAKLRASGLNPSRPRIVSLEPRYIEVRSGESFTIRARAVGTGPLTFGWRQQDESGTSLNPFFTGSNTETLTVTATDARWTGYYTMTATGRAGTTVSEPVYVKVAPSAPPGLARSIESQRVNVGRPVTLSVAVTDETGVSYQWYHDGQLLPGQIHSSIVIDRVAMANAGKYRVVVSNALGGTTAETTLAVVAAPVLINVATRALVEGGDGTLIVGFVVADVPGNLHRTNLVRAVGPGLARFGVAAPIADPKITLFDARGREVGANDNWHDAAGAQRAARKGFELTTLSKDAALDFHAPNGAYTMQVTAADGARGVALAEVYEDETDRRGRLVNLSTRAFVGAGENIAIPGFVLEGEGRARLLIRGVGPTLGRFNVEGALANPSLTVFDRDARIIATNDDWSTAASAAELAEAAARAGAFALPDGSRDAAVLLELPAGSYTAQVSGVGGTMGVALVEVYDVP